MLLLPLVTIGEERYAIIVGHNRGESNEDPLRFAEGDAKRYSELLMEVGHIQKNHLELLVAPRKHTLEETFSRIRKKISVAKRKGKQSIFFFYFAGHGDDKSLHLGGERFERQVLLRNIQAIPSSDRRTALAVRSGRLLIHRHTKNKIQLAEVDLPFGGRYRVGLSEFVEQPHDILSRRGAQIKLYPNRLYLGYEFSLVFFDGQALIGHGGNLSYSIELGNWALAFVLGARWVNYKTDWAESRDIQASLGVFVGLEEKTEIHNNSIGFGGSAGALLSMPLGKRFELYTLARMSIAAYRMTGQDLSESWAPIYSVVFQSGAGYRF